MTARKGGAPRWACRLLARLAGPARADEVVGDLEEAHHIRKGRHGGFVATVLTALEALDVAVALLRHRRLVRRARDAERRTPVALGRGSAWVSAVDVRLGLRLLRKHPGITGVSALGILVAVAIGASVFGALHTLTSSDLAIPGGDRIVTVQNTTAMGIELARSTHLHDLEAWRADVPALEELGAYRIVTRNVIGPDGGVIPTRVVEMTASGFRIAGSRPLLGRPLVEGDERPEALDVVVIGHGVWRDRFGSDPGVLGRTIRIGDDRHTVVGVMPADFAFPINNRVWTPFRLDPDAFPSGAAPPIDVFGRLAPGASLDEAQAQLEVVAARRASERLVPTEDVRVRVQPYSQELFWGTRAWLLHGVQLVVSLLLVVIAVNVAALIYARTMARSSEIAVRTALGASRGRIAGQLFVEAFLLSGLATVGGLVAAHFVLARIDVWVRASGGEQAPFWWDFSLTPATVAYALVLALVAALIIGVVPALGATGSGLRDRMQGSAFGSSGAGPGKIWTALITLQVAVAVAVMPVAFRGVSAQAGARTLESPFPLQEILFTELYLDRDDEGLPADDGYAARHLALRTELVRRLEEMPEVTEVAVTAPAPWQDPDLPFELDGGPVRRHGVTPMESASSGHRVGRSEVGLDFFSAFDMPVVSGRALDARDAEAEAPPVVVNRTFVDLVTGGASPVGRRIRFPDGPRAEASDAPWHEIVGVVPDLFGATVSNPEARAYLPLPADRVGRRVGLTVRVRGGDPAAVAGSLRGLAVAVDPMLRLSDVETLDVRLLGDGGLGTLVVGAIVALAGSTLALAVAGLFALMSFTVVRRRREIGIRTALGASPERVVASILTRASGQLAAGIVVGIALAWALDRMVGGELLGTRKELLLPAVAALMTLVGVLAAWGPARRGLAVEPSEALRSE